MRDTLGLVSLGCQLNGRRRGSGQFLGRAVFLPRAGYLPLPPNEFCFFPATKVTQQYPHTPASIADLGRPDAFVMPQFFLVSPAKSR